MLERELLIQELWRRLADVEGVAYTARNPKAEPSVSDMPCIQFFELDDEPKKSSSRGVSQSLAYRREFKVIIEAFVKGTTDAKASQELGAFMIKMKRSLYTGGNVLTQNTEFLESAMSRMLRPPVGDNVIGVGITLTIQYIEDIGKLFT